MKASIEVKNLCLDVPTFEQQQPEGASWTRVLLGAVVARQKRSFRRLLDDITFTLEEGDRLALIGRNGAGKSTLLRVLTGAYVPTEGVLKVNGTRQALLNIKLGFNKQATLVENIYLRGTAMGIPTKRVRELIRSVLEFAGLEEKAQDRLYTLSSGQRMRLGFAIATAVSQDIILMDEWLGAGDAAFLERARERMNDRVAGSKIVILASHNARLVKRICNKGLLLRGGRIQYFGDIDEALRMYKREVKAAKHVRGAAEQVVDQTVAGKPAATADDSAPVKRRRKAKKPKVDDVGKRSRKSGKGVQLTQRAEPCSNPVTPHSGKDGDAKRADADTATPKPPAKTGKAAKADKKTKPGSRDGAAITDGKD